MLLKIQIKIVMEKKLYVKPQSQKIEVESTALLAGSPDAPQLQNYDGEEWGDN